MAKKSKSHFLGTYLALALVGGFTVWTFWGYRSSFEEKKVQEEKSKSLSAFSTADVTEFIVKKTDAKKPESLESRFHLKKEDGNRWRVLLPYSDLAEQGEVERALNTVVTGRYTDVVAEGESVDFKRFGLDRPMGELTFARGEQKRRIQIGGIKAYDQSLYGRVDEDNRVVVLPASLESILDQDPREFREKKMMVDVPESFWNSVDRVEVSIRGSRPNRFELVKAQSGDWQIQGENPKPDAPWRSDSGEIAKYIRTLQEFKVTEISAEDKTDPKAIGARNLKSPIFEIKWHAPESKQTHSLQISEHKSNGLSVVSSSRSVIGSVVRPSIDYVLSGTKAFMDRQWPFQFNPDEVRELTVKAPKAISKGLSQGPLVFKKSLDTGASGGGWIIANNESEDSKSAEPKEVDGEKIDNLIREISLFRAKDRIAGSKPSWNEVMEVELRGSPLQGQTEGPVLLALQIGVKNKTDKSSESEQSIGVSSLAPGWIIAMDEGAYDRLPKEFFKEPKK